MSQVLSRRRGISDMAIFAVTATGLLRQSGEGKITAEQAFWRGLLGRCPSCDGSPCQAPADFAPSARNIN